MGGPMNMRPGMNNMGPGPMNNMNQMNGMNMQRPQMTAPNRPLFPAAAQVRFSLVYHQLVKMYVYLQMAKGNIFIVLVISIWIKFFNGYW